MTRADRLLARCTLLIVAVLLTVTVGARADEVPDFNRDIQPILSENCYHCHGPDGAQRKAGLRLDDPKSAFAVNDKGVAAIVASDAEKSELVRRIHSTDPDEQMPPPDSNRQLSPKQIDLLKRWVDGGAKWGEHWAFTPPQRPPLPAVKDQAWGRNAIDRFLLCRLESEGLAPSPETTKEKLIRRVTFDLTGLPPTPEEIDAFLADQAPDAYEKVVDRLLASPRYGERMVFDWLDASRYADSNGYQADPIRTSWPWRDWVIEAMNSNMPYDQFVIEQLAGDLLPNATMRQRLATAFNRNHTFNGEGGRIPAETRVENVFDRTETFGTVFLGLTVGCVRCHDHKFDPITQREYYQLYAYFNQSSETGDHTYVGGGNVVPVMAVATGEQEQKLEKPRADLAAAEAKLNESLAQVDAEQAQWEAGISTTVTTAPQWTVAAPTAFSSQGGASLSKLEDQSILSGGTLPATDVYEVVLRTDQTGLTSLRLEVLGHDSLPHGGPGRADDNGNFVLTAIEGEAVSVVDPNQTRPLAFIPTASTADYSQPGWDVAGAVDADPASGWAVMSAPTKDLSARFAFAEPLGFEGGTELRLRFKQEFNNGTPHLLGRFRLSLSTQPLLPPEVIAALGVPAEQRDDAQKQQVRDYYRKTVSTTFRPLNDTVESARKAVADMDAALTKVMVMDDAMPRETFILSRGAYDKPAEKVEPGVLSVLNPLPQGIEKNDRLALAKWLVDPANPLFARVTVNRHWQKFFGIGIVKTAEDFGVQGEKPVHPELLDWLAVEFRESGWDVKALHRLIVTSSAYRQSSKVSPELLDRDPENRLLARAPRQRLPSFMIRDQALAMSGLLVGTIGGPPVKPYQPPGVWEEMSLDQIKYEPDKGDALWRRSLYTFWRRTVAPTTMFDVPQRTVCSVRTVRTNTPLHALALLNDVTYVEAARHLAERLLLDAKLATPEQKLEHAFRLATARKPTEAEAGILKAAVERLRAEYAADTEAATQLVSVGEKPRDANVDVSELAAWTSVVGMIMNLDEAITQE